MIKIDLPENVVDMGQRIHYEYLSLKDLMKTVLNTTENIERPTYEFFMQDYIEKSVTWEIFKEELINNFKPEGNYNNYEIDFNREVIIFYE